MCPIEMTASEETLTRSILFVQVTLHSHTLKKAHVGDMLMHDPSNILLLRI